MTIQQLTHILLSLPDLDKEVKVADCGAIGEITFLNFDNDGNFIIGTSGYKDDKLSVESNVIVKSPHYNKPYKIF